MLHIQYLAHVDDITTFRPGIGDIILPNLLYKTSCSVPYSILSTSNNQTVKQSISTTQFDLIHSTIQNNNHNGVHQAGCQLRQRERAAGRARHLQGSQQAGRQGLRCSHWHSVSSLLFYKNLQQSLILCSASAAKDALTDKAHESKHDAKAEAHKQQI